MEQSEIDSQMGFYILRDKQIVRVGHLEASQWMDDSVLKLETEKGTQVIGRNNLHERWVAETFLDNEKVRVSTVFLAINYNWLDVEHPILFETMIIGLDMIEDDYYDKFFKRCKTYEEALVQHQKAVEFATEEIKKRSLL